VWLVAALPAAATAGGIFYAASHRPNHPDKPVDAPSATAAPPLPAAPTVPNEQPTSNEKPIAPPED